MYCGTVRVRLDPRRRPASEDARFFELEPFVPISWDDDGAACKVLVIDRLAAATEPEMLLFVHGFSNSFADAIRRVTSLAYDIGDQGVVGVWSWPSAGSQSDYLWDDESVQWTRRNLRSYLKLLAGVANLDRVHLVAHSMGNRVLLDTLEPIDPTTSGLVPLLDDIVFAAPDVVGDVFARSVPQFGALADRLTLYANDKDWALWFSEWWYHDGQRRAGRGGADIIVADDLQSVDATGLSHGAGHAYTFNTQDGVADVQKLVIQDLDARARGLPERPKGHLSYWLLGSGP
jgi:esterase/lipase superfamily enzyme